MSINPVSASISNDLASDTEGHADTQRTPAASESDLERRSNRELPNPPSPSAPPELPQDEVEVQRDPAGSGQIVVKYLDAKGNLILQVPSAQVLKLARSIEQALDSQAKSRTVANTGSEGEPHGNQS